jgi:hypothetical protein
MSTMRRRPLGRVDVRDSHPLQRAVMSLPTWSLRTCLCNEIKLLKSLEKIIRTGLASTVLGNITRSTAVKIAFLDSTLHLGQKKMVNRRYEEDNSGATIEASIMRSKGHGLMSEDKSEDRICYLFPRD